MNSINNKKSLIFCDAEWERWTQCEKIEDLQKRCTVQLDDNTTLTICEGEPICISDNASWALPEHKNVVRFFNFGFYLYILFEDNCICTVNHRQPRQEIRVWKAVAESLEQYADIRDFLVFKPSRCTFSAAPCAVAVHTDGTLSVIEGKESASVCKKALTQVASLKNVAHIYRFGEGLSVFFEDGTIKTIGVEEDILAEHTYRFVKPLTDSTYLIAKEIGYLLVDGATQAIHEINNTIKVIYDTYNVYYLTDERCFSEASWADTNEPTKIFNQEKHTIKDFWVKHIYSEEPKIVVLYKEGYAIASDGHFVFDTIDNVCNAEYIDGELYLYANTDAETTLTIKQKDGYSLEKVKELSLQTLERIYRRLGNKPYYHQGTNGMYDVQISNFDYSLLEKNDLFNRFAQAAEHYSALTLKDLKRPSLTRSTQFENATIFTWEDIVSVVELVHFINMYELPSFTAEMYFAENEHTKPYRFTFANNNESDKSKQISTTEEEVDPEFLDYINSVINYFFGHCDWLEDREEEAHTTLCEEATVQCLHFVELLNDSGISCPHSINMQFLFSSVDLADGVVGGKFSRRDDIVTTKQTGIHRLNRSIFDYIPKLKMGKKRLLILGLAVFPYWLREEDSNFRPSGYEPDELPLLHPAICERSHECLHSIAH